MLRSVAVESGSPAAAFLKSLQRDLVRFGREDTILLDAGDVTAFIWEPDFATAASPALREETFSARLTGRRAELAATERSLPPDHFASFDIDFGRLAIEIVPCLRGTAEDKLFDYVAEGQSVSAELRTMRVGKFLVYDRAPHPARVVGAIALRSPMYFDGARDSHLGWPPLFTIDGGVRTKSVPAINLRNSALKSIYNISVCMAATPYDVHGFGKLIAALTFSKPVIEHMEATYGDPVLGLTTTGAWGGSAGQYERIRLGHDVINGRRAKLFERTHGASRSMNYPLAHFSQATFDAAFVLLSWSHVRSGQYREYRTNAAVKHKMLFAATRLIGIPRRALASNVIAHYFGSVSGHCRHALSSIAALSAPPAERGIEVASVYAEWLARTPLQPLVGVRAKRLSDLAT